MYRLDIRYGDEWDTLLTDYNASELVAIGQFYWDACVVYIPTNTMVWSSELGYIGDTLARHKFIW